MRWFSLSLAFLALLGFAFADSPSRTRRSYKNLYVRQHLAAPSATSCSDADGDGTTDSILRTGDICVDSDDETFCFYADSEYHCISGASTASQHREKVLPHDDFLQFDTLSDSTANEALKTRSFHWWKLYSDGSFGVSYLSPSSDEGHLGVAYFTLENNEDGGIRSPASGEDREFRIKPSNYSKITMHVVMKVDASNDQPGDMQLNIGFCELVDGGECDGNDRAVVELMARSDTFADPAYGQIGCRAGANNYTAEFSPSWEVDENWHRYSVVWDVSASTVTVYKDGTSVASCSSTYLDPDTTYYIVPATAETGNSNPTSQTIYLDYVQLVVEPKSTTQR